MDDKDEKTIIEKLVDTVKNVASDLATTASNAAQYATESDAKDVAEKTDEQMYKPADAVAMPIPVVSKRTPTPQKADRTKPFPNLSGRITPTYDIPLPEPMAFPVEDQKVSAKKKIKSSSRKTAPEEARKITKKKLGPKISNDSKGSTRQSSSPRSGKTTKVAKRKTPKKTKR